MQGTRWVKEAKELDLWDKGSWVENKVGVLRERGSLHNGDTLPDIQIWRIC